MTESPPFLHNFHQRLSAHLVANLQRACRRSATRERLHEDLRDELVNYLATQFADDSGPSLLLGAEEMLELRLDAAAACRRAAWEPYAALYHRRVLAVPEIQRHLTKQDAEDWSEWSAGYASRLETPGVTLAEAIEIVAEWTRVITRYLLAMGKKQFAARPDGDFPTPLSPVETVVTPLRSHDPYLEKFRVALQKYPADGHPTAKELLSRVPANRKEALRAIRELRHTGEYRGPTRSQKK